MPKREQQEKCREREKDGRKKRRIQSDSECYCGSVRERSTFIAGVK